MRGFVDQSLPEEVLQAFPPDRDGLCLLASSLVSDRALREIAVSDSRGESQSNFIVLKGLREGGVEIPEGVWIEDAMRHFLYHRPLGNTAETRDEFQVARAFCACYELGRVGRSIDVFESAYGDLLAVLMEASLVTTPSFRRALARLITWSLSSVLAHSHEHLRQIFALFCTVAYDASPDDRITEILALWVDGFSEEYDLKTVTDSLRPGESWWPQDETWVSVGTGNLRDRLPLQSELRYALEEMLPPRR